MPGNPFNQSQFRATRAVGLSATAGSILVGGIDCALVALHFDLSQFPVKDREKVKLSVSVVLIFAAIAFPSIATTGVWGSPNFGCCLGWFTILDEYIYAGSPYKVRRSFPCS